MHACVSPLVSVIVPAYNAETFIGFTLDSVVSQTYKNIEVLVVDDGSQDRTGKIVQSIAQRDSRITLVQQSNQGVAAARNLAIEKSSGEYIAPVDADDIWYPQKLEKQVQCLLQAELSVGLVYSRSIQIDAAGFPVISGKVSFKKPVIKPEGKVYFALVRSNFVGNSSTPLIRRACFETVGYYNCQMKQQEAQGCEDWELYLRIAERYQFRVVPEVLVGYRQVSGGMSSNSRSMRRGFEVIRADVQRRHPEVPDLILRRANVENYFYLANRSNQCHNPGGALVWLLKALGSDFSTTLLRRKFYRVVWQSLSRLTTRLIASSVYLARSIATRQQHKSDHQVIEIPEISKQTK